METFHGIDFPNNGCGLSTCVAHTYTMLYKYGQETQKLCTIGFNTVEVTDKTFAEFVGDLLCQKSLKKLSEHHPKAHRKWNKKAKSLHIQSTMTMLCDTVTEPCADVTASSKTNLL